VLLTSVTLHPGGYPEPEAYPFCIPVLRETRRIGFSSPVTFFVGENGSGRPNSSSRRTRRS